jgi:capsule polysaccharide export protein KpsE/RkpR
MCKIHVVFFFSMILIILITSGCINNAQTNNTWGEKKISIDAIKISQNTTGNRSETNESRYYVYGYIENDNPIEAFNLKMKITTFYENGTVFAVNTTPKIKPQTIPGKGSSFFYARFHDPHQNIHNFTVEISSAKGEFWS